MEEGAGYSISVLTSLHLLFVSRKRLQKSLAETCRAFGASPPRQVKGEEKQRDGEIQIVCGGKRPSQSPGSDLAGV